MDDAIHGGNQIIFVIMGGNTHVFIVEIGGKGMLCLRNCTMIAVNAHDFHEIIGKPALQVYRVTLEQEAVVNCRSFADFCNQRHDGCAEGFKKLIQRFGGKSRLVLI